MPNPDGSLTPAEFEQARQQMLGGQQSAAQPQPGIDASVSYDPAEWKDGVYVGPQGGEISLDEFRRAQQVDNADAAIAQLPKNPKADQGGLMGWVTGNSRQEYDIPEFSPGLGGQLATSTALGDEGKMGIIQKMYADEAPTFTADKFGNIMVSFGAGANEGKTFYVNQPGFSAQDATTLGTNLAMTAIPGGLAARGALGLGLRGTLAVGGSAAVGAMAGDTARQVAGNAMGDTSRNDNLVPGIDLPEMITAGAGEGLGAGVGYAASTYPRLAGAPADVVQNVRDAGVLSENTGIPFTRGQVINTPAARTRMSNLGEYPQTSGEMTDALAAQTTKTKTAVEQIVNPPTTGPGILADTRAQNAAAAVVKNAKDARKAAADPAYAAALDSNPPVDTTPLVANLEKVRNGLTKNDPLRPTLDKALEDLNAGDMWQLTPRQLQGVRIATNDAREEALRQGKNGLANSLKPVVDEITTFIEGNAKGYTAANQLWTDLTKPIDQLEGSAIGALAKSDSFTLGKFTERLFGENSALKGQRQFVKENLDKVDPTIYPDLARAELQRRLSLIPDYGMGGGERNVPAQLNKALFGTEASRDMWKQALPGMEQAIDDLADALDIAARGRAKESGTVAKGAEADAATSAVEKARLRDTTVYGTLLSAARWAVTKTAEKAGGPFTTRIRQGQLAEEVNVNFPKAADDLLEEMRKSNKAADRAIVAFIQSAKQYAASEPDPEDKPKAKQGVLAQ